MLGYVVKRLLQTVVVLIGVTLITFILVNVVPGDPVRVMLGPRATPQAIEMVRHQLGFDKPLPVQYAEFLKNAVKLDFGESYFSRQPVIKMIAQRFVVTVKLALISVLVAIIVGIGIGILAAKNRGKPIDTILMGGTIISTSVPDFWLAMILQIIFGIVFNLLPISGLRSPLHYVLPVLALGIGSSAGLARMTRTGILEVINQDYIRTARAKGLAERIVILKHALRNAMIPLITIIGGMIGGMLTGTIMIEQVFAIPGLGRLSLESISNRDIPLIQGVVVFEAIIFVLFNLLVDLSYGVIDPRIKLGEGEV